MADKVKDIVREADPLFEYFEEVVSMCDVPVSSFVIDHIGYKFGSVFPWKRYKAAFEIEMKNPRDVVYTSIVNGRRIALAYMEVPYRRSEFSVHTIELMEPKEVKNGINRGFCVIKIYPAGSMSHEELANQLAEGSSLEKERRGDGMIDVVMRDDMVIRCSKDSVWNKVASELPQ